ncbi:MAG: TipAS antibiotic-recognition domain-containing protein, partial [Anaerolineales bacterium]
LHEHRLLLQAEIERLKVLVGTVDNTIARLRGELDMDEKEIFGGLTADQQESYKKEAIERWGEEEVSQSYRLWDSYSESQKQEIMKEGNAIYQDLVDCISLGHADARTKAEITRWHRHLRYFYEPSIARLRGLGEMYVNHPEFAERFRKMHPDLPEFLRAAINSYCDDLEKNT